MTPGVMFLSCASCYHLKKKTQKNNTSERLPVCLFPVLFFSPTLRHLKPFYFFFLQTVTRATRLNSCRGEQKVPLGGREASVVSERKTTNKQRADYAYIFMNERLLLLHVCKSDVHTSGLACVLCRTARRHSVLMPPSSYHLVLYGGVRICVQKKLF